MAADPSLNAYVLCGGASRRMGRDKALLPHPRGGTLLERAVACAATLARRVMLLSGRSPRYPEFGLREIDDPVPGCGPLAGVCAALADTGEHPALILPVDLPWLSGKELAALLAAFLAADEPLVLARDARRSFPVLGIWDPSCRPAAETALRAGERKLHLLAGELGARHVLLATAALRNWNAPADLAGEEG